MAPLLAAPNSSTLDSWPSFLLIFFVQEPLNSSFLKKLNDSPIHLFLLRDIELYFISTFQVVVNTFAMRLKS